MVLCQFHSDECVSLASSLIEIDINYTEILSFNDLLNVQYLKGVYIMKRKFQ